MKTLYYLLLTCIPVIVKAQCTVPVNFQFQGNNPATTPGNTNHYLTAKRDTSVSKPYVYVAAMEKGLLVMNINNPATPTLAASIGTVSIKNLYVMSVTQAGNYLYMAVGNSFNATSQVSGLSIVDINNPALPVVKDTYTFTATSGSGHVAVDGNYAYLSAMQNGILVLNISNPSSISFVSQFIPSINFPLNNPNVFQRGKINSRQSVIKNNLLYHAYDAGGVRIIDITNKSALSEVGMYSNPALLNKIRAYNNLVVNDTLVYVAADYAGMEILNVKQPATISQVSWWNPWAVGTHTNNVAEWANSPGHTNEIEFDENCETLFMSAGRTDVIAVDVSNPLAPDSCSQFGNKTDTLGTWGLGRYKNQIYLGYLNTAVPFNSVWGGLKILNYNSCTQTSVHEAAKPSYIFIHPNPAENSISIGSHMTDPIEHYELYNVYGALLKKEIYTNEPIHIETLSAGIYFIRTYDSAHRIATQKFIKK